MAPGFRHQNVGELFRPERYTLNINTNTSLFHHLTLFYCHRYKIDVRDNPLTLLWSEVYFSDPQHPPHPGQPPGE
jgi:hypothetical protein